MKYLWIGVGNSEEGRAHFIKNGGKLLSAEVSNDALLAGLDACGISADSINSSYLPPYPAYKEKTVSSFEWTYANGAKGKNVGYYNKKYINLISKRKRLVKEAKAWARENVNEEITVFVYSMHTPFMAAATAVKRINPKTRIVLLVPDLPQYMDMNMSIVKKILKKIDWITIKRNMKRVDKYVLYSKHMANFLKLKEGSFMVMEGSFDSSLLVDADKKSDDGKISVMYSGVLDLRYGIKELLDAMNLLGDNYELWLTGNGNAVPLIEEKAKIDARIKYFGYFPSREELLKKQREATMLISTRDPSEPASRYCFPSKIFEYMISGNPVLSTVIEGIPDEYFDYLIPLLDITPNTLSEKIKQVAEMDKEDRESLGNKSRSFILENKNNVAQMRRIIEFLN